MKTRHEERKGFFTQKNGSGTELGGLLQFSEQGHIHIPSKILEAGDFDGSNKYFLSAGDSGKLISPRASGGGTYNIVLPQASTITAGWNIILTAHVGNRNYNLVGYPGNANSGDEDVIFGNIIGHTGTSSGKFTQWPVSAAPTLSSPLNRLTIQSGATRYAPPIISIVFTGTKFYLQVIAAVSANSKLIINND